MRLSLSLFGAAFISARATPYGYPYALQPPLVTPAAEPDCSLEVFDSTLDNYNLVERAHYTPSCSGTWEKVVLRLQGSVAGVQFDRWGAVWLNGVELLRLTTPEPDQDGIAWAVEKDVSEYADVFTRAGEAVLQIPNTVNNEYTGALYIKVRFDFYYGSPLPSGRHVVPLVNFASATNPVNAMGIKGGESTSASFALPTKNIGNMWVDVMASGHAGEEFWYSNLPDDNPNHASGGGAYREFRIFIDGTLAGIAFPFPVIYTGGFNPLLWHPLTGIESFDIEAYRFDISHFLPILNDGGQHVMTVDVVHNSQGGFWYLDPTLIMDEDPDVTTFLPNAFTTKFNDEPAVMVQESEDRLTVFTTGSHHFKAGSSMTGDNGRVVEYRISSTLDAWNQNEIVGSNSQFTSGEMKQNITVTKGTKGEAPSKVLQMISKFPYSMTDETADDVATFEIDSTVSFSRQVSMEITDVGRTPEFFTASWSNKIDAGAVYNRSNTDHSDIKKATNSASELFQIKNSLSNLCYDRHASAVNGYTIIDSGAVDTCNWPYGLSFCGEKVCGLPHSLLNAGDGVHTELAAVPDVDTQVMGLMAARPQLPPLGATQGGKGRMETLLVRRPGGKTTVGQPHVVV